jgi:PAS domain S-box-containing protein
MDTDRALALVHNNTEGKRRELLIQQQSSLITSLLDSIPDIISFKDTNGVYLGCNPPFEAFVGRSRDQIVGRTDYDLFSQEVADAFRANDAKMLEGDESRHNDEWITYPDGRSILIDTLKTPYRGAAGERIGILGISRDITERYRAEAQVKAQERLYRGLVESQSDLIVRVDMKHRFTFVNDAYCQTFGKTREELIGQEFAPLVHPDDLAATMESLKGLEYPPYRVKVEQRAMTRTGWRWIAWEDSGILNDEGGVIEIQAVGRDITDFRQAMMALERLSGIQDSLMHLATGLINIPVAGQDAAINQALGDIGKQIAADRAYLMSYDFETGLIRNTHEWCDAGIEPQIANLQFVPMADVPEWVAAHKAGRTIEVECVSALSPEDPLRHILEPRGIQSLITLPLTGEGQCLGFIGFDAVRNQRAWTGEERDLLRILAEIFANFATRNKLDQRLIMARDQADSASKAKSEFLANMSHELRTPLNAVIGFSEALTDRYFGGLTDKQSQYVRYISDAGRHLLALINDILDLSKIEAGRMELELSPISVRDVLEGSLVMIKERCFVHRLALALTIAPELNERVIEADARKVKQIMFNLLSNAAKFTPDGGSITVNARLIEDDHGPRVEVSVADTGIGIPGELQQKVFEPFHQLLGRRRDKTPGTGLGLSVSRKLINLHGGEISLESGGVDKGTRVSFWLPGARAPLQKVSDWGTGCAGSDSIPREGAAP